MDVNDLPDDGFRLAGRLPRKSAVDIVHDWKSQGFEPRGLVPPQVEEAIADAFLRSFPWSWVQPSWEARLAREIEYRRISNRLRRIRNELAHRLVHASRALRGIDCDPW